MLLFEVFARFRWVFLLVGLLVFLCFLVFARGFVLVLVSVLRSSESFRPGLVRGVVLGQTRVPVLGETGGLTVLPASGETGGRMGSGGWHRRQVLARVRLQLEVDQVGRSPLGVRIRLLVLDLG